MPAPGRHRLFSLLILAVALAGCTAWQGGREPLSAHALELTATPFFPQRDYHCGPAALATVLGASGVAVTPDALAPAVYLPERRGSLQVELKAAARRHGRLAVELDGDLAAIVAQLDSGTPVLVLQNLASRLLPVWHYAVVVGYQPERQRFVLRSGTERRRLAGRGRFAATWERAGRWAVVLLDPAETPVGVTAEAYLQAAADLESTGDHEGALEAFRSARRAWPDEPLARLGEANNLYYLGRLSGAETAYRNLIAFDRQQPVAVHNLVMLLVEQQRGCEAAAVLEAAAALSGPLLDSARRAAPDPCPP